MSFYVVITLDAQNVKGSITTRLNKEINLRGDWEVAINDTNLIEGEADYYVFCDFVDYTFINDGLAPLIGIIKSAEPAKMYVRVNKKRFSSINMEIKFHLTKDLPATILNDSYFILHFRKA